MWINALSFLLVMFELFTMTKESYVSLKQQYELNVLLNIEKHFLVDCSGNYFLNDNSETSQWLKSHYKMIHMTRKDSKTFNNFPPNSIINSFPVLKRTPLINNSAEVLYNDGSGKRYDNMTYISKKTLPSFIVNYSFYHLSDTFYNSRNSFFKNGINYHIDEMTDEMGSKLYCRFSFQNVIGMSIP